MKEEEKPYLVGCIPIDACPEHPTDQSPCVQIPCPFCRKLMWYSQMKRNLVNGNSERYKVVCLRCIAMVHMAAGYSLEDIEMLNIAKSGGIQ